MSFWRSWAYTRSSLLPPLLCFLEATGEEFIDDVGQIPEPNALDDAIDCVDYEENFCVIVPVVARFDEPCEEDGLDGHYDVGESQAVDFLCHGTFRRLCHTLKMA